MGAEFGIFVNNEKQERIGNLVGVSVDVFTPFTKDSVRRFFSETEVNENTIKEFLLLQSEDYKFMFEFILTNIEDGGENYNSILREILDEGPFVNPQELVFAISKYIKSHISYDTFSMLSQALNSKNSESLFAQVLDMPELDFTLYHMSIIKNMFGEFKGGEGMEDLPEEFTEEMKKMMLIMMEFANNDDIGGLKDYIANLSKEGVHVFGKLLEMIISQEQEDRAYSNETISQILKNTKTGVCRHFSMIAKKMYNDVISRGDESIQFTGESEVLYVSSQSQSHAYNVLIYEDSDGEIKKEYFDITNFLFQPQLFNENDFTPPEDEMYVEIQTSPRGLSS